MKVRTEVAHRHPHTGEHKRVGDKYYVAPSPAVKRLLRRGVIREEPAAMEPEAEDGVGRDDAAVLELGGGAAGAGTDDNDEDAPDQGNAEPV